MAHEQVEFRNREFWAKGALFDQWMALLIDEIEKDPTIPLWLGQLRDWWKMCAYQQLECVDKRLDEFLTSDDRVNMVVGFAERALARVKSLGVPLLEQTYAKIIGVKPAISNDTAQWPEWVSRVGETFIKLLRGEPYADITDVPVHGP